MLLPLLVAADADEIRLEPHAAASLCLVGAVRLMLLMGLFADARGTPSVDVEALSAHEPVLSNLFRASWNEFKLLAVAVVTVVLQSAILQDLLVVVLEQAPAEALRVRAHPEALVFHALRALPGDVDAALHGLVGVVELPRHHLLGAGRHANLLDQLQNLALALRLDHYDGDASLCTCMY